jgi:hypothetical protein
MLVVLTLGTPASFASDVGKTAPLFTSNDILDVTIRAPFTTIMRERSDDEDQPATLTYNDAEAGEVSLDLGVRTRGRFRREAKTCKWAPLRLNFKKSTVESTVFAGSDKMKLVTHCRNGATVYSQALLSEHLAYRILNLLTDASFRVRLMRVTYVDSDKDDREHTEFAFMIEDKDQVAKRIGLDVNETPKTEVRFLEARHLNLTSLYQYLIGNTDFSPIRAAPGEPCCHNYVLFGAEKGSILPIPYDFDMSGIVDAPHSAPSLNFKLRNVRERLYRGRCDNNEHIAASIQAFVERKSGIYELVTSNEFYRDKTRNETLRFLDEFYQTIEDPRRVQSELIDQCVG